MRRFSVAVLVCVATSCAPSEVRGPANDDKPACNGASCSDPIPIGGEGEGAFGEGEGEGDIGGEGEGVFGEGEGEGDLAGEGEGDIGEGEGDIAGEGEGGGGATGVLLVTAGPEQVDALHGCQCFANAPASNVDIDLVAGTGGGECKKPADFSCGVDGGKCSCGLPGAQWFISRQETPRDANEIWPIDEAVLHGGVGGAADGTFTVRASVAASGDCLLSPASLSTSVEQACLNLDCSGEFGAPSCFDYTQLGGDCQIASTNAATVATDVDCMVRGTVPVRVHVEVGGSSLSRDFCTTLDDGGAVDALVIRRTAGAYAVQSVSPSLTEVAVGAACP